MEKDAHASPNNQWGRSTNVRHALLGGICLVAMVMLWWMYSDQNKIQALSTMQAGDTAAGALREQIKVNICECESC